MRRCAEAIGESELQAGEHILGSGRGRSYAALLQVADSDARTTSVIHKTYNKAPIRRSGP